MYPRTSCHHVPSTRGSFGPLGRRRPKGELDENVRRRYRFDLEHSPPLALQVDRLPIEEQIRLRGVGLAWASLPYDR